MHFLKSDKKFKENIIKICGKAYGKILAEYMFIKTLEKRDRKNF